MFNALGRRRLACLLPLVVACAAAETARAQSTADASAGLFNEVTDDRRLAAYAFSGFDSWRGPADGSLQNNNGLHAGLNLGGPLPLLSDSGFAWQFGGSFGVYDWTGRTLAVDEFAGSQQQSFLTAGIFRRASESSAWSSGLAVDQMIANNFGFFTTEPYLCQLRFQTAYALGPRNEVGLWGTRELNHDTQTVIFVPITVRAVNQLNLFWRHRFDLGADGSIYLGMPTNDRVGMPGTLGNWIVGGSFNLPLNDRLAVYTSATYLNPTAPAPEPMFIGSSAANEYCFNLTAGVAWHFGRNARSRTVAGRRWTPYLPVANNGSFLVDQDLSF